MDARVEMTAGQMADRLAAVTSQPANYYARQIRGWAQAGLFGDLRTRGAGPTAPNIFNEYHLAMARNYSALTRMGFDIRSLGKIAKADIGFEDTPAGRPRKRGISFVVDQFIGGDAGWYLTVFAGEDGDIGNGTFTKSPFPDEKAFRIAGSRRPIFLTLSLETLWSGLFEETADAGA